MNNVNKTLYIPLYGKAYVSQKGVFLDDKKAEDIWAKEGFTLKGKSKSKWLAYYMGIRSAVFDSWLTHQMTEMKDAAVIHIGCGMDSRALRVGASNHMWYDIDLPDVICERKKYYSETSQYQMIAGDVSRGDWLTKIPKANCAIIVMEGVSMYLTSEQLQSITSSLNARFEKVSLLLDCYTVFAAKMSKYKNPVNDVGVTKVYGIDDPTILQSGDLTFVKEHDMTPQNLIDELHGIERFIFKNIYAGSFSKKLYRLFEYKKV